MKQEELDFLYNFLHDNYIYSPEGMLIAKKSRPGVKKGQELGSLKLERLGRPAYMCHIKMPWGNSRWRISHLIWIYFYKIKPKYIVHKNGNIADTRIENLVSSESRVAFENKKQYKTLRKGYFKSPNAKRKNAFMVQVESLGRKIYIGIYNSEQKAQDAFYFAKSLMNKISDDNELKAKVHEKHPVFINNKTGYTGVRQSGS